MEDFGDFDNREPLALGLEEEEVPAVLRAPSFGATSVGGGSVVSDHPPPSIPSAAPEPLAPATIGSSLGPAAEPDPFGLPPELTPSAAPLPLPPPSAASPLRPPSRGQADDFGLLAEAGPPPPGPSGRPPLGPGAGLLSTPPRPMSAASGSPSILRQDSGTSSKHGGRRNVRIEPSPGQTVVYMEPASTFGSPYTPVATAGATGSPLHPGVSPNSRPGSASGRRVSVREGGNVYPTRLLATGDAFIEDTPLQGPLMSKDEEEGLNKSFRSGIVHAGWLHKLVGKTPLDVHWKKYWVSAGWGSG
ncbi:hypothetical protein HYH02_006116 [Chlamydomonas schloesseri]|uniref:Uncharacterized protein n=1 Tax=Chlamydomonas schloesseri TaxID=2026947 RepID=A0A836B663_9CHLO|nr:hypothetical protein HYH02_006116 [Chlamydomonas schloesseri]|eukprot:KAG2448762.1 hypothetical protein HYH02_006116 [Chlamydomonas schloesseri]